MTIKPSFLSLVFTLTILSGLVASDERVKTCMDEYYPLFNTPREGDSSLLPLYNRFHVGVPDAIRAEVLGEMLNKAHSEQGKSELVVWHIMEYLEGTEPNLANDPRVDQCLSILVKGPDPDLRKSVLMFLYSLKRDKDLALFVESLNDPEDKVRTAGLVAMYGRPESEALYQKFLQDHQSDSAYDKSMRAARELLEASRQGIKMNSRIGTTQTSEGSPERNSNETKLDPEAGSSSQPSHSQVTTLQASSENTSGKWRLALAGLTVACIAAVVFFRMLRKSR